MRPEPTDHDDEFDGREPTLGALLRKLSHEFSTLLRQEIELARAELDDKVGQVQRAVAALAVGALLAFAGAIFALLAVAILLGTALDSMALGSGIVGVAALAVGVALVMRGRQQLDADELAPTRTIESLRKDAELAAGSLPAGERH